MQASALKAPIDEPAGDDLDVVALAVGPDRRHELVADELEELVLEPLAVADVCPRSASSARPLTLSQE